MSRKGKVTNFFIYLFIFYFGFIFLFALYRMKAYWGTPGLRMPLMFGSISLAFVILGIISLRLREEVRANIALSIVSLSIGVYMSEFFLFSYKTLTKNRNKKQEYKEMLVARAKERGINYDMRTKMEVIDDLAEQGVDAFPGFFPAEHYRLLFKENLEFFPLTGVSNKTTVLCNEGGEYTIYKSDEYGFNNPADLWDDKNIDIVLVGDSFTQGACVNEGEDIAGRLRQDNFKALTLGVGGNAPLLELATIKEYAQNLKPKNLVWIYYESDLRGLVLESRYPLLMKYLEEDFSQDLMAKQNEINDFLIDFIAEKKKEVQQKQAQVEKSNFKQTLMHRIKLYSLRELTKLDESVMPESLDLFTEILKDAQKTVSEWGGKMYFVYLPDSIRYQNKKGVDLEKDYTTKDREAVLNIVNELGIPIIDIHEQVFVDHPNPMGLFPLELPNKHYNADGYAAVAKEIRKKLSQSGYTPNTN